MAMIKKTLALTEENLKTIINFGNTTYNETNEDDSNVSALARNLLNSLEMASTDVSLKFIERKIFSIEELYYLLDMSNGTMYNSRIPYKAQLTMNISGAADFDCLEEKYNVPAQNLKVKIMNLTEFECYILVLSIMSFWSNDEATSDMNKWIKSNFAILQEGEKVE